MKTILIFDDEEAFQDNLRDRLSFLNDSFQIKTPKNEEFLEWMQVLAERQREFRRSGTWSGEEIPFDKVDIFIVDYDLFGTASFLTAEDVAYLGRCFSRCGLIVGVNQYGHNPFDLTLQGHPQSFADLNIGQEQLGIPGLWGNHEGGFRPWHWPILPSYLNTFERKVEDVREGLQADTPISEVIGFGAEVFSLLPRSTGEFIGRYPSETLFQEFVVHSEIGLRPKDVQVRDMDEAILARVGAARISKWLERFVLPGQDILVDAPHLVSRYPSLLRGDRADIETWNKTASLVNYEELGLSTDVIEPFRLQKGYWVSRPAWFWKQLRECEEIQEVREPWTIERPSWVFCEDTSTFCEEYEEFVADVESPFTRRFVSRVDRVDYQPAYRFSL
jgi:hypothetical protein